MNSATKSRFSFIADQLSRGTAEYYSRDFSIHIEWDGKVTFTFQVIDNSSKRVLETTQVDYLLGDSVEPGPPILVVWDKALDELDRLKTKYILDYDGDTNRFKRTAAPMEG